MKITKNLVWVLATTLSLNALAQTSATPTPAQTPAPASQVPATPTPAPDAVSSFFKELQISGFLDLYYQYDFNRPPVGTSLFGRWYDVKNNQEGLATFQLNVVKPATNKQVGFTLDLEIGNNADVLHATEPGGVNRYKNVVQAYGTYITPGKTPVTFDFGKFYSWVGYEGLESPSDDNYGRSFLFTLGQPDYATGIRVGASPNSKLTTTVYAINGYNEVEDSNNGKTFGATAAYQLNPRLTLTVDYYGGQEGSGTPNEVGSYGGIGFPTPGSHTVNLVDAYAVDQFTSKDKFVLEGTYADADAGNSSTRGHWSGAEMIYKRQFSDHQALALRAEEFADNQGLRSGTPVLLHSLTGTYDLSLTKDFMLRFEVREDYANAPVFQGAASGHKQRTTLTFAQIFKF